MNLIKFVCNRKLKSMKKILVITVLTVITAACADKKTEGTSEKLSAETAEVTADPKDLLSKEWQLKELNGAQIKLDTTFDKHPYLKFNDIKSASGNLGCNGFGAKVEFIGSSGLKLTEITSTEMACGNLEIETKFSEALQNTTNYVVLENILYLNNSENTTIATLEAAVNQ